MNNQFYKLFQVMEFFITKYDYVNVQIKNLVKPNELFIVSKDNKTYPLIRISNDSLVVFNNDEERIKKIIEVLSTQFNIDESKVLDIHINNEDVDNSEKLKTICINSDHYSGEDLESLYPGIHECIKESNNEEEAISKSINNINEKFYNLRQKAKNRPLLKKIKDNHTPATFIIMAICILLYLLSLILKAKGYSSSASLVVLGGDYKMFTLGLHEFYRLITGAFVHSNFFHLFFNLWSFYIVASVIEKNMGTKKMLVMLFTGILFSSLTAGCLSGNGLVIGLSGGIYCLFIYLIVFYIGSGFINTRTFMPTLLINLALNFLPGVSWKTHLGGAICGLLFYYIYKDKNINKNLCALLFVVLIGLGYKYVKDDNIKPYYSGTDSEVLEVYYDLGFKNLAVNKLNKLMEIYNSK